MALLRQLRILQAQRHAVAREKRSGGIGVVTGLLLFHGLFACQPKVGDQGTIIVKVRLAANFNTQVITGMRIVLDGAGDTAVAFPAIQPTQQDFGGFVVTREVANCDNDSAKEFCVTFSSNPMAGLTYDVDIHGDFGSIPLAIKCQIFMGAKTKEVVVEKTADGDSLTMKSGSSVSAVCDVPCTEGDMSCVGNIAAPTFTTVSPASPANNNSPRIFGVASDSSQTIRVYLDSSCAQTAVGEGTGAELATTGIAASVGDDTTNTIYAKAFDSQSRTSACTATGISYVEDSTAPARPEVTGTSPVAPANFNSPRVFGTAESLSFVRIFGDPQCDAGAVAAGPANAFADGGIAVSVADNTATTFFATATDDAGNTSLCSLTAASYREDSLAEAPIVTRVAPMPPANNISPRIFGSAEANSHVRVYAEPGCGSGVIGSGPSDQFFGDAGIGVTVPANQTTAFYAQLTDDAGNVSACSDAGVVYREDSTQPVAPTVGAVWPPPPANNNLPRVVGTAESLSWIRIYGDSSCAGGVLASGTAAEFVIDAGADAGIAVPVVDESATTFYATATDDAGNVSLCSASFVVFREDSQAPAAPSNLTVAPTPPANVNNPVIKGTTEALSFVRVYTDSLCSGSVAATGTAAVFSQGSGITVNVADNFDGGFFATAMDDAGNVSPCSPGVLYVEDSIAPSTPTIYANPVGPANNNIPSFYGTAELGSTVRLYADGGCSGNLIATLSAVAFAAGQTIAVGDNTSTTVSATATDDAGNVSECNSVGATYIEDTMSPMPAILKTDPPSGASWTTPRVVGTAEALSTVRLYTESTCDAGPIGQGTAEQFVTGLTVSVAKNAATTIHAKATDTLGNLSPCSSPGHVYVEREPARSLACGWSHCCATVDGGGIACWGKNDNGQLGDGTSASSSLPVGVSGTDGGVFELGESQGGSHSCARRVDGGVVCWGSNSYGELGADSGVSSSLVPIDVWGFGTGAGAYDLGANHTCATTPGGQLKCWGTNDYCQLGVDAGGCSGFGTSRSSPVDVWGLTETVFTASAGYQHSCAIVLDGTVKCWGRNLSGSVGDGTTTERNAPVTATVLAPDSVQITAGLNHTCAISSAGVVRCWGSNSDGQLGGDAGNPSFTPIEVEGLPGSPVTVVAGNSKSCAITDGGRLICWGDNYYGELGDGTRKDRKTPVDVWGLDGGVVAVSLGSSFTCARLSTGAIRCWGSWTDGHLGDGSQLSASRLTPVDVPTLNRNVTALSIGSAHVCARMDGGAVVCWGDCGSGQLGGGHDRCSAGAPTQVFGLDGGVLRVETGTNHTCVLTATGGVKCWGANSFGQLGDGTTTERNTPVDVSGMSAGVAFLAVRDNRGCAITTAGAVKCWGEGRDGLLGNDASVNMSLPVGAIGLDGGIAEVALALDTACARSDAGAMWCWGKNNLGQIGNDASVDVYVPTMVSGLSSGVVAIAVGDRNGCAIVDGGIVKCWGYNANGACGIGNTTSPQKVPVNVARMDGGVTFIVMGSNHGCGIAGAGAGILRCWGYNWDCQVGNGQACTSTAQTIAADVAGLDGGVNVVGIWDETSCAIATGGVLKCWGENQAGLVGNGATADVTTPISPTGIDGGIVAFTMGQYNVCAISDAGAVKCWGTDSYGQVNASFSGYPRAVVGFGP